MIWLHVLHGAAEADWDASVVEPDEALPFLDHLEEARVVLEANADSEELVVFLLDHAGEQGPALQRVMAHRGSPGFASLLLAQLDTHTREALLPCSVQEGVDWRLNNLKPHATWSASSCMARCARHDGCTAFVFAQPPKDGELPGRPARPNS